MKSSVVACFVGFGLAVGAAGCSAPSGTAPETVGAGAFASVASAESGSAPAAKAKAKAKRVKPPVIDVASTWKRLEHKKFDTSFSVLTTDDLFVLVKVDPSYEGEMIGLNFVSPDGGTLEGYVATVAAGAATFDVKILGTYVGRNAETGTFALVVGDMATQTEMGRTTIALTL